ncbi:MAG TPA: DUF5916 domain-containing protein [Gemmatimonadaceae bacterium]|nr:DUF5916 domain-containing protein [Gemmatimonadaceae bacterium]
MRALAFSILTCAPALAGAQSVEAIRLSGASPRLDGRLTEDVWRTTSSVTGLVQRDPVEGAPAAERTEVRFAYDDDALWIGARMYSTSPATIRALVTRHDREGSSEQLIVSLDTHHDRRTAYTFAVTPASVRIDYYHPGDDEDRQDEDFDPVWQAQARLDSLGWTAEMRIPFSQLRFSVAAVQTWGVNVVRSVPARNERSYWALVRRDETGWASRMGTLVGIRDVRPSRRIELVPYAAVDSRLTGDVDPRDPFAEEYDMNARVGADVKVGLGPSFTLDLTLNPDFGQVEADPAEVNLSAFETFFDERRPFFTEGSELLEGRDFFYSRRIGASPPGRVEADYVEPLDHTSILSAAKLTGRTPSRLSVAALAAVTGRETVRTFDTATTTFGEDVVAPTTGYVVVAAQQQFGRNASTLGGVLTSVHRYLEPGSPLASVVTGDAFSGIVEGRLRWAGGAYDISGFAGFAHVRGDSGAILRLQRSSRRYWQRPDASHVEVDPRRRTLGGTILGISHSKVAGAHWLWDVDYWQETPGLEPNDIGAYGSVDDRFFAADLTYRETRPHGWYRSYSADVSARSEWNFEGIRQQTDLELEFRTTLANYLRLNSELSYQPRALSDDLTRGGPLMGTGRGWRMAFEVQNREGARTRWGVEAEVEGAEFGGWVRQIEGDFTFHPGTQWEISVDPRWGRGEEPRQYVTTQANGRPETFGSRNIFAHVDRSEVAAPVRVNYTFTPNLTLETYVEPFASSGRYHGFGELLAPKSRDLLEYGTNGTTIERNGDGSHTVIAGADTFDLENEDFNIRSLRSNVVLRWEWRPGSTLYVVWQQDQEADRAFQPVGPRDLWDAFRTTGDSFFAVKVSYWLPM